MRYRMARIGLLDGSMYGWLGAKAPGQFSFMGNAAGGLGRSAVGPSSDLLTARSRSCRINRHVAQLDPESLS